MAKPDIGEVRHQCGTVAAVRKDKKDGLYLACPCCGLVRMSLPGGQSWILENATIYGPEGKPEKMVPATESKPEPALKPITATPPPPAAPSRRPFFATILD